MNITVLAKFVPNPTGTPELGPDNLLVRTAGDGALDPGDEYGLELALQLAEAAGGEVTVVSMGPDEALAGVQRALAMGAHKAVLVTDPALRGADALVTARVLAAAIARQPADLVVAGVESTDGYTGTVPVTVAELLGMASVTAARTLVADGDGFRIERQTETGYDVFACAVPRARDRHRRRDRAALPEPQGHHGGEVQAGRAADRRRPRRRRPRRDAVGGRRHRRAAEGRRRDRVRRRRRRRASPICSRKRR